MADFFHLSGAMLGPGSIIKSGNWGRIIRSWKWQHNSAFREMVLESARVLRFPHRPSRLECAFAFRSLDDARVFRQFNFNGFGKHVLYRVALCDPEAPAHDADTRLLNPLGDLRPDWADAYWMERAKQLDAIPGLDASLRAAPPLPEMLTLSDLRVEEVIEQP